MTDPALLIALAACRACSTKILLNSCSLSVVHQNSRSERKRLCIKVGRGQGDRDVGTRVWGLGTWGRETRDLGTSSMGRGDVKNRDAGDAGCE